VRGQVPSGCLNTSHMDSWITALNFFLFCLFQVWTAPAQHKEPLEMILYNKVRFVCYGDDFLGNKGKGLGAAYFSVFQYAEFCAKYTGFKIRDMVSGAPFVSQECSGFLTKKGATMLKHQFIKNPYRDEPGQCTFLAYRESREFLIRAIWGRETRQRDALDVMMSCVGHAYGTYAANPDAYKRLLYLYEALISNMDITPGLAMHEVVNRATHDDLRKMRQVGISSDDLLKGFPTWDTLKSKNMMDWVYHDNILDNIDVDAEGVEENYWF